MNCKPGDLAIIVKCDGYPQVIGSIVEVLRPHPIPYSWRVKFVSNVPDGVDCAVGNLVGIKDYCLRPVSGLPMEEETEQKLKEPA